MLVNNQLNSLLRQIIDSVHLIFSQAISTINGTFLLISVFHSLIFQKLFQFFNNIYTKILIIASKCKILTFFLLFLSEAEAEGGEPESEADAESDAEVVEPESKSLEEEIEESGENSKELKRKARKIVNKSVDISIGYVTSSVSTGKRRRKRQTSDEKDFVGKIPKIFYC